MSSYLRVTRNPKTNKFETAAWVDDHFGPHKYGVKFKDSDFINPDEVELETRDGKSTDGIQWSDIFPDAKAPNEQVYEDQEEKELLTNEERQEAQKAAINWLISQCEDQMVRGWLITMRENMKGMYIR